MDRLRFVGMAIAVASAAVAVMARVPAEAVEIRACINRRGRMLHSLESPVGPQGTPGVAGPAGLRRREVGRPAGHQVQLLGFIAAVLARLSAASGS